MTKFLARGELVGIRPMTPEDHRLLYEITRDSCLQRNLNFVDDTPFETWLANEPPLTGVECIVVSLADGKPAGFISLGSPHDPVLIAMLLPEFRRLGIGTEASRLMLGYGFTSLGMSRVSASAFAHNTASWRVLEKLGFVRHPNEDKAEDNAWGEGKVTELCYHLDKESFQI